MERKTSRGEEPLARTSSVQGCLHPPRSAPASDLALTAVSWRLSRSSEDVSEDKFRMAVWEGKATLFDALFPFGSSAR